MPFEFYSSAGLKILAIFKDTAIDYDCVTVLFKVRFTLTYFISILTQVTVDYETHKLVDNYSLHFDELEYLILITAIRAAHVFSHVLSAQHVVANFVCAAHRICQDLETHPACKRVAGAQLRFFYYLLSLYCGFHSLQGLLSESLIFLFLDGHDLCIGCLVCLGELLLGEFFIQLADVLRART